MNIPRTLSFPVWLWLALTGCAPAPRDQPQPMPPARPAQPSPPQPDRTVTVQISAGQSLGYSAPGHAGWGDDLAFVADLAQQSDRMVLEIDTRSNQVTVRRLIEAFRASHGFWQTLVLSQGKPETAHESREALIRLDKQIYSDEEPVPLTIQINKAPWWLFSPEHIRIRDERGNDVHILHRPVSQTDNRIRSKVLYDQSSQTIDLTSFREPYYGIEYVHRFAPGMYKATYYFVMDHECPEYAGDAATFLAYPQVWGGKHSNSVTFTVVPAAQLPAVDIPKLLRTASEAIAGNHVNEAVRIYKRIVLHATDRAVLENAIQQILLIRRGAAWDDPEDQRTNLSAEIDKAWRESRGYGTRWPEAAAFGLSLLHVSEAEREEWCWRYVRQELGEPPAGDRDSGAAKINHDVRFNDLFHYPQFRSILDRALKDPDRCPRPYVEIVLRLPTEKETKTMVAFLKRFPDKVLRYYAEHKAPPSVVPLLAANFDDATAISGNGGTVWRRGDAALLAFETALGLDLGYGETRRPRWEDQVVRIRDRQLIKGVLESLWRRRRHEYGVTEGAGADILAARLEAIRDADAVLEAREMTVSVEEGIRVINLDGIRTIHGTSVRSSARVAIPDASSLPEAAALEGRRVIVCVTKNRAGEKYEFQIVKPGAFWLAP